MEKKNTVPKKKVENNNGNVSSVGNLGGNGGGKIKNLLNTITNGNSLPNVETEVEVKEEKKLPAPVTPITEITKVEEKGNQKEEQELSGFDQFIARVKAMDEPQNKKVVYIDEDLHRIFCMLKMKSIPISKVINTVLLEWIDTNQKEIKDLIHTDNKFLKT